MSVIKRAGAAASTGTAVHYEDAPLRMQELWEWVVAVDAFDYGDRAPLAHLVRERPMPPELIDAVASIVDGSRKPRAKRGKIPPAERMQIAATVSVFQGLCDMLRLESNHQGERFIERAAEQQKTEVHKVVVSLRASYREPVAAAAKHFSVSNETIENLLREMRERIARWPTV